MRIKTIYIEIRSFTSFNLIKIPRKSFSEEKNYSLDKVQFNQKNTNKSQEKKQLLKHKWGITFLSMGTLSVFLRNLHFYFILTSNFIN